MHTGELTDTFIQSFGAVLVCKTLPKKELFRIDQLCRTRKLKGESGEEKVAPVVFFVAVNHGVTGHIFADFGDAHVVKDPDGEPLKTLVVDSWTESGKITVAAKKHGFEQGQKIRFEDIEGGVCKSGQVNLSVLNGATGIKVRAFIKRLYEKYLFTKADGTKEERERQIFESFQLDLSEAKTADGKVITPEELGPWKTGGIITEVVDPIIKEFRSLEDSLVKPAQGWEQDLWGPPHPDQGAWEKGAGKHVHLQFVTVLEFEAKYGFFPRLHNVEDSDNFVKLFETINEENKKSEKGVTVESVDKRRLRSYSWYFATELTGYCAFLGGIVAQEVVKKFGKYTPIFQWMHSDHIQLVGNAVPADAVPQGSRYDHQISIFGKSFQQLISNQRIFLVGCGALGCEYLKGLAMMGVCTGPKGKLWCTDMDRIEVSNLSRQFLFRAGHVTKPKSITAAAAAKQMNPALNVEALEMKVWAETENFFDDHFWDNLDLCWNALDNVIARKYTDSKCLFHGKPLLESGTQGTKCNSEVIIPFKTKYGCFVRVYYYPKNRILFF
ncbi:ubiquitin activating enzyme 2 [Reticulomyxa filosa]|uniref:Ubiquitin activating enzyme 2 n=1 Tax=Reticulomyxa filosa TaxID=46433 RepID=X6LVF5_RETFI|nr:ubiquitin activating enzyme 2 [Reticulomyxa filosa]|eukprot:ETO05878.1 ubiquitin activating enzyme 2 [Reticulomyxa filosa]